MSKKYIKQIDSKNFVYPNYNLAEYDTEIIHNINNNGVTGTISNLTGVFTGTTITISFNYTWALNGAEPFVNDAGTTNILSVHMMDPSQKFYKPFALINYYSIPTGSTVYSGSTSITVSPSQVGLTSFSNGNFNFEFRFIGHRSVFPICATVPLTGPIPTPTPTPTPSSTPTYPTPTPTPTSIGSYTSGATINVTDPGWIKYTSLTGGTSTYEFISSTGSKVINGGGCVICGTITPGFPFADVAAFTITTCGTACGGITPTPTPSATPSSGYNYYIMNAYSCFPCADIGQVVARVTGVLTTGLFFTIGDGNVYEVYSATSGPSFDVNLDGYTSASTCSMACSL